MWVYLDPRTGGLSKTIEAPVVAERPEQQHSKGETRLDDENGCEFCCRGHAGGGGVGVDFVVPRCMTRAARRVCRFRCGRKASRRRRRWVGTIGRQKTLKISWSGLWLDMHHGWVYLVHMG